MRNSWPIPSSLPRFGYARSSSLSLCFPSFFFFLLSFFLQFSNYFSAYFVQTIAELRLQGRVHTVSTVSFTPLESLRQDYVVDREQRDMVKTPLYVSSCTSVECNTKNSSGSDSERDSKYSSVGSPDSWLREESSASKARGRREGGREYREASKWEESGRPNFCPDIFCDSGAKVYPENVPKGRPPRAGHK